MTQPRPRFLVVQCAALGWNLFDPKSPELAGLRFSPLQTLSPGLTCPAQASFRTASEPSAHGMVANGLYHPLLRRPLFWEQSASQVAGPRIWDPFRARGGSVGLLFWQQSLGENVDLLLSPRPIHKHSGGMIQDCHSRPTPLYNRLRSAVGRPFNLMHYWGPLASRKASEWITDATLALLGMPDLRPDLLLTYLPHLDYDTQRFGPHHPKSRTALAELGTCLRRLHNAADREGYTLLVWGDYAMHPVSGPALLPNLALRDAGLLPVRPIRGMAYPDLWSARAFAMVDHEIAHIHIPDPSDLPATAQLLRSLGGIDRILPRAEVPELNHPHSGDLIAFAQPGRWFAYPWWRHPREAPDYATHVDIHNKPGFDPCELFFGRLPWQVCTDPSRVGGTHGTSGTPAAWACSDPTFRPTAPTLLSLASTLRDTLAP